MQDPRAFKHVANVTARRKKKGPRSALTDLQVTAVKACLQKCVQIYKKAVHMIPLTDGGNIWTEMCAGSPNVAV